MDSFREINSEEELESLRSALYSNEALYFIGAGCSQSLGFPGWGGLIESLIKNFAAEEIKYDQSSDFLDLASQVKKILRDRDSIDDYYSVLHGTFRQPPGKPVVGRTDSWPQQSKIHQALFQFPIKSVVTTNYDHAIQHYLKDLNINIHVENIMPYEKGPVGDFLFCLKDKAKFRAVLHIHGDHQSAQNIILAREDYDDVYKPYREENGQKIILDSTHRKILWTLLTTRCLIFVGFSLSDKYLNEILREVCKDVWGSFRERHFAIFPYEPQNKDVLIDQKNRFLRDYSIQTIFYNSRNRHEELVELLEFLCETPKDSIEPAVESKVDVSEQEDIRRKMKEMNRKAVPEL